MATDEASVVDGRAQGSFDAADVGHDSGRRLEGLLDGVLRGQHRHGDERDVGTGVDSTGVDAPPAEGVVDA